MDFKILLIKVLPLIYVTSAKFNLQSLNTTNKSLDTHNQIKITLNYTGDYNDDSYDNYNDNDFDYVNNDPVIKTRIQQQHHLAEGKLNSLLKITKTTTINKFSKYLTTNQKLFKDKRITEPKNHLNVVSNYLHKFTTTTRIALNFNNQNNSCDNYENNTNYNKEHFDLNNKLKTDVENLDKEGKEEESEKRTDAMPSNKIQKHEQQPVNDFKNAKKGQYEEDKKYQMKYYVSPYSLSNAFFGQLPQFQLQPQQLHLNLSQEQQPSSLSQEYHYISDYRFLSNPERYTEFYLHTLIVSNETSEATETTLASHEDTVSHEDATTTPTLLRNDFEDNGKTDDVEENMMARILKIITDTIGAVFGVNTSPVAGIQSIHTEEIELHNGLSLKQSRFNPFNPCRILIHGWLGTSKASFYNTLIPKYFKLQHGSYNIITVDWGKGAVADYITASYRVKPVGMAVAKFIDFLHRESGIPIKNIHVIGFSMGAHIAGIAGKFIKTGRLPVIYGLDPALPFFRYKNVNERLDIGDADYVEVIHTSVGSYGYDHPLGHVDFYINYGYNQPGCFFNECSHFRAFQVYAESLSNEIMEGRECSRELWLDMIKYKKCMMETGRKLKMSVEGLTFSEMIKRRGVYFMSTNAKPPYKMT